MNHPSTNNPASPSRTGNNTVFSGVGGDLQFKLEDLGPVCLIFLYCLLFAVLRLSVSSTMELDESEQFLNGSSFSLGYAHQPPFYSWIVYIVSQPLGMNLGTLIVVKYTILFSFYLSFYLIARSFWSRKNSLLITGSLLLFPTYSYEFNRDLSHSILATAMAAITCYLFVRLQNRPRTIGYLLVGATAGLGLLSKYNFAFFLLALLLAAAYDREGRRVLLSGKIFLSISGLLIIVTPHIVWLMQNNFLPFRHAFAKAESGNLPLSAFGGISRLIISSYSGVAIFLLVFGIMFGSRILPASGENLSPLRIFRSLAVFGLTVPLAVIILLRTGHFSERWLAPLLFILPLAAFSKVDFGPGGSRLVLLGSLCILVAAAIFLARSFIGFFPDAAGKVERIHTPFREISVQLGRELRKNDLGDTRHLGIVTESEFLAANIKYWLPEAELYLVDGGRDENASLAKTKSEVLLWDAAEAGEKVPDKLLHDFPSAIPLSTLKAPYLRSARFPPYAMGVAIIR